MPVLDDEAGIYGYTLENRHFVEAFRAGAGRTRRSRTASLSSRC